MYRIEFYEAAAQLLPLLYLTMLVEYRFIAPAPHPSAAYRRVRSALLYVTALSFAVGEFAALRVLAFGPAQHSFGNGMIVLAFMIGFGALIFPVANHINTEQEAMRKRWHGWILWAAAFGLFMLAAVAATALWG